MNKFFKLGLSIVLFFHLAGCAASRSGFNLDMPVAGSSVSNGKQVYIRSVEDIRKFEDKPNIPEVPLLSGGLANADAGIKSRAIARERNSFGKAMGNIFLDQGNTVESVIHAAVQTTFESLGYDVVENQAQAKPDALIVDVSVESFWGWLTPGAFSIKLENKIITTSRVTSNAGTKSFIVAVHESLSYRGATEGSWKKSFKTALQKYVDQSKVEFKNVNK